MKIATQIQLWCTQIQQGETVNVYIGALHTMALEQRFQVPEFLRHSNFTSTACGAIIMTSHVLSQKCYLNIFATPVQDGYAVCYNPQPQSMEFAVASWRSCSSTCSRGMTWHIQQALMEC